MGKKPSETHVNVEELRATNSFLSSARSLLVGENDKLLQSLDDQITENEKIRNELSVKTNQLATKTTQLADADKRLIYVRNDHEASCRTLAKDHMNTYAKLDNALNGNDRRNLVIFLLSIPYVIAIVGFIAHHLSVSIH